MKSLLKRSARLLLVCSVAFSLMTISASAKTVTAKMKKDQDFMTMCKYFTAYTDSYLASNPAKRTVTHKMNAKNQLDMAAYIAANVGNQTYYSADSIHEWTKNLFGTKPSVKKIPSSTSSNRKWICKTPASYNTSMSYMYAGGSWGSYKPLGKLSKVEKVKGYYIATIKNKLGSWESSKKVVTGTSKVYIKSYKGSALNYKVFKIVTTGSGRGYF